MTYTATAPDADRPFLPQPGAARAWFVAPLLAISLVASSCFGAMFVVLPYRMVHLGGTDADVGLVGGLYQGCYVAAMLASAALFDRVNARLMAVTGNVLLAAAAALMATAQRKEWLLAAVAVYGIATAWHWPLVMGLISTGAEGAALNRRLGRFNAAWSGGLIVGPYIGGSLYAPATATAFLAVAGLHAVCAVLFVTVQAHAGQQAHGSPADGPARSDETGEMPTEPVAAANGITGDIRAFRTMARVGLLCSYMAVGLIRYHMPVVAQEDLNIRAAQFAPVSTSFSAAQTAGFVVLGLSATWHFRAGWFWIAHAVLGGALLMGSAAASRGGLILCSVVAGLGVSFLYASHLYYGVSGGRHRARLMTLHEILLSLGFIVGSYGGGLTAEWFGRRFPYVLLCVIMLAAVGVESVLRGRRRSSA